MVEVGTPHARSADCNRLLLELIPAGAPRLLSAAQAKVLLAPVRPRDVASGTRRQLAAELLADIVRLDRKLKDSDKRLREAVAATGTGLLELYGLGPVGAARVLGDVLDVPRFQSKAHFASWNGTAPLDASSGEQVRHRLSRAGNRRINGVLHIMAIVQLRNDTPGRAYYRRKVRHEALLAGTQAALRDAASRNTLWPAAGAAALLAAVPVGRLLPPTVALGLAAVVIIATLALGLQRKAHGAMPVADAA